MLHIIGLGLNENSITKEAEKALKECENVYLENYTVDFPYSLEDLEKILDKKIISCDREFIEQKTSAWILEAKDKDVALLVYGSPLTATTHMTIVDEAKNQSVNYRIYHNASIFEAILESGLQFYKFGKTASMPAWEEDKNYRPDSFIDLVKDNKKIDAHSLILCDISLSFLNAIKQLEKVAKNNSLNLDKIVVCSEMGTENKKVFYGNLENLSKENSKEEIKNPFCLIIPGKLHFTEEKFLKKLWLNNILKNKRFLKLLNKGKFIKFDW